MIHPGIFFEQALWTDSGSLPMNTFASRDQFKPIQIGGKLLLNYSMIRAITLSDIVFSRVSLKCPPSVQMERAMVAGRFRRYKMATRFSELLKKYRVLPLKLVVATLIFSCL